MDGTVVICGLLVVVGLFGIVVPVLPGHPARPARLLRVGLGGRDGESWSVFAVATVVLAVGTVVKYLVPGRRLKAAVPTSTLVVGGLVAIVGFFVIPVVGMLVGFPIGIYVAERVRVGAAGAWPSTRAALVALAHSILIELVAALLATAVWIAGVVAS